MSFCLIPSLADEFLAKLRKGEIDPDKLTDMTSTERRAFFSEFMGEENAKSTNALFESKLLLKNQQQGIINWAKQITGIKPELQRDIISKAERMTEVLQPKELDSFLADLAEQRLGFGVTAQEAGTIAELSKEVATKKMGWDGKKWKSEEVRLDYGRAKYAFGEYVSNIKNEANKQSLSDMVKNPLGTLYKAAGMAKSLKATLDNSAIGRQGLKVLWTHPTVWGKNAAQSFIDIAKVIGGKDVMAEVQADLLSRPNAMNGLYRKEKLALQNTEEAFPENISEKIPAFGRLFKASETAYGSFLQKTRADVFDKYVEIANKSGADIKGIGRVVNSLTGRGNLGRLEPVADVVNTVFFGPRFVKANIDVLTAHLGDKGVGRFAKKQAAINLLKVVAGTTAVIAIAKALGGQAETDSRSSDFGKLKIGNTRFDLTGGMGGLLVLVSRLGTMSTKSTSTGEITPLNTGEFGGKTGLDLLETFIGNKLSPAAGVVRDLLKGQDMRGNKPTIEGELVNTLVPLPITNYMELSKDPNSAPLILSLIADGVGISANNISSTVKVPSLDSEKDSSIIDEVSRLASKKQKPSVSNFETPTGRLKELKNQLGNDKFDEASTFFHDGFVAEVEPVIAGEKYKKAPADVKKKIIDKINTKWTNKTLQNYGYKRVKKGHVADVETEV